MNLHLIKAFKNIVFSEHYSSYLFFNFCKYLSLGQL